MICEICGKETAQYKCPACGCHTCCLNCVKLHKLQRNCTGQKPKTEFVPMKEMTAETLYRDINLYDQANVALINASDRLPKSFNKLTQIQKKIRKACSDRGIDINFMPGISSRSKSNKTQIVRDDKNQMILWTINWRFFDETKTKRYELTTNKINEESKLGFVLKGIFETCPNDFVAHLNLNNIIVLMNAERVEGGVFYELDNEFSINDNLCGKCIIEYPIFNIIPKETKEQWKICSPFTQGKTIEQEMKEDEERMKKEEEEIEKEEKGPDFEEIKRSLKLDLIASFNQEMDEMKK